MFVNYLKGAPAPRRNEDLEVHPRGIVRHRGRICREHISIDRMGDSYSRQCSSSDDRRALSEGCPPSESSSLPHERAQDSSLSRYARIDCPRHPIDFGPKEITLGILGNNLLNEDIRNHVSYTKDVVLLPGATVKLFANLKF